MEDGKVDWDLINQRVHCERERLHKMRRMNKETLIEYYYLKKIEITVGAGLLGGIIGLIIGAILSRIALCL
jgi:hypothetical protein